LGLAGRPFQSKEESRRLHGPRGCRISDRKRPADYALIVDGQLLGVVEAKKVGLAPQTVLTQAERYSKGISGGSLNFGGYRVPLLYATNGEVFWFQDVRDARNRSRRLPGFHTPAALTEMLARDSQDAPGWFTANPNEHPWLRPYQREANDAVEAAMARGKRQMLVAMATGTGKTFTLVNQCYRLLKSSAGKRILFLVDRRALAAQAVRAFASFDAREVPVALPPLDEQEEIARRLLAVERSLHSIRDHLGTATVRTEHLISAVLAKAFAGELVPTEAELARAEGRDYETGEQLLTRIRAERGQDDATAKQHSRRTIPERSRRTRSGPSPSRTANAARAR
jgi:hypothetical protein